MSAALSWDGGIPRIIGHRGSPREAPENTLASFQAALAAGTQAVELDARLSADGVVVVHHDAELGRVLPGTEAVESLAARDLAARGAPLLSDVLALPLLVNVEIKGDAQNAAQLPERVFDAVREAGAMERVLVTSFDPDLADDHARRAGHRAGMIVPYAPDAEDLESYPRLGVVAIAADAVMEDTIASLHALGRKVLVWTVNDPAEAEALLRAGADGIITDRPGALRRHLAAVGLAP